MGIISRRLLWMMGRSDCGPANGVGSNLKMRLTTSGWNAAEETNGSRRGAK